MSSRTAATALVVAVAILLWVPRHAGPLDLRWDGAAYYILGTSLAEGRGYRLLNEPGEIAAVQYPPLLPAIVAVHQLVLGTSDPTVVGRWLRLSSCLVFLVYAVVALRFLRGWLPLRYAVLGTLLSLLTFQAWFMSDVLFPEVWFSVATLLFLMSARRSDSRSQSAVAYLWAVVAYGLRTVGLVGFAVWVLDSVFRRRFRQAALRAVLALVPVVSWQIYVAAVERSDEYNHPAYEYQRAPYLFYNVSYARNIALRDPFTPEKGAVVMSRRVARNAFSLAVPFGETLSASSGYFDTWLHAVAGDGPVRDQIISWGVFTVMFVVAGVLVGGGAGLLLLNGQPLVPLYLMVYSAALCLTPFPGQYPRYLMPVAPLIALCAIVLLVRLGPEQLRSHGRPSIRKLLPFVVLGPALMIQAIAAAIVYGQEYRPIEYVDTAGRPVSYRLFFYDEARREFDNAIDYLQRHAQAGDVVAAGTPHWVHLRTGLKTVMPPFEANVAKAQALLDSVPVKYLLIGEDVVAAERYTLPVVRQFDDRWQPVHSTHEGWWTIYQRQGDRRSLHDGGASPH